PGQSAQPNASVEARAQHLGGALRLPRCESAGHGLGQASQAAISLQQMGAEHEAELVYRQHARPVSGRSERQNGLGQLRNDQIVLADAELVILNRLDLMIPRNFIQALARHMIVDVVEAAIEGARETRLQVEDAGAELRYKGNIDFSTLDLQLVASQRHGLYGDRSRIAAGLLRMSSAPPKGPRRCCPLLDGNRRRVCRQKRHFSRPAGPIRLWTLA